MSVETIKDNEGGVVGFVSNTKKSIKQIFMDEEGHPNCEKLGRFCSIVLDGEPVFIIRARDKFATNIVKEYLNTTKENKVSKTVIDRVTTALQSINKWRKENRSQIKIPD